MSDFVSNCPVSRPAQVDADPHVDMNGVMWNDQWGFIYKSLDEFLPFKTPPPDNPKRNSV